MNQPTQQQQLPGREALLQPVADHGEQRYKGSGCLVGKVVLLAGGDSGPAIDSDPTHSQAFARRRNRDTPGLSCLHERLRPLAGVAA